LPVRQPGKPLAELEPLTVGTAGHIDHGKTALVEALTGTNTDRLEEERRRGISIELGYARMILGDGRAVSIVDVPGHERFVRTMVAGATGIDVFLLAIAVDDGVMPQTMEHIAVLRALRVDHGVVALTKCDLASSERVSSVAAKAGSLLPSAPLVQASARDGRGLTEVRDALAKVAAAAAQEETPLNDGWSPAMLHIDRVFSLRGVGTVVTGTLRGGVMRRGEKVSVLPRCLPARIRSIEVHGEAVEIALPRQRVALNLVALRGREVRRGDVVAAATGVPRLPASYRADVALRLDGRVGSLDGERVQMHHGTRQVPARLLYLDDAGRFGQLRLDSTVIGRPGDRVVLRSIAGRDTLGGAEIIDPNPSRHGRGARGAELGLIVDGAPAELILASVDSGARVPVDLREWNRVALLRLAKHRHSDDAWLQALGSLLSDGILVEDGGLVLRSDGLPAALRPVAACPAPTVADREVLAILAADGARPRPCHAIAQELDRSPGEVEGSIRRLASARLAIRLGGGVAYEARAYDRLHGLLISMIRQRGGSISIAEARDGLATSRKYAQALLEHLDATRATVRRGDRHHLRLHVGRQGSGGPAGLQSQ
jgi:selenocysteine-specific elongation factor